MRTDMLNRRVDALERYSTAGAIVWHLMLWPVGHTWEQVRDAYGADRINRGDNAVFRIIAATGPDRKSVATPDRDREIARATAWLNGDDVSAG